MSQHRPWIQLPIVRILDESETGLQVLTPGGLRPWLPKAKIDYVWGAVLIPAWIARKLKVAKG